MNDGLLRHPADSEAWKSFDSKVAFGSHKSIFRKYFIFWKCYFPERKMYSGVWLPRNSFYRKSILVFGSYKHFTENDFRFTENQFPCLVRSNILWKMEFVFYGKSILMFGLWIILRKITIQAPALPKQTCNSTKIFIHFNIKNNHPNSSIYIA